MPEQPAPQPILRAQGDTPVSVWPTSRTSSNAKIPFRAPQSTQTTPCAGYIDSPRSGCRAPLPRPAITAALGLATRPRPRGTADPASPDRRAGLSDTRGAGTAWGTTQTHRPFPVPGTGPGSGRGSPAAAPLRKCRRSGPAGSATPRPTGRSPGPQRVRREVPGRGSAAAAERRRPAARRARLQGSMAAPGPVTTATAGRNALRDGRGGKGRERREGGPAVRRH